MSMKYIIEINTQEVLVIARILAEVIAEVVRYGPRGRTLLGTAGEPIGSTRLLNEH